MNSPCINCGADARVCKECDWYNGVWISKDQYEAKLKSDMVAMLTEIQLEIEEEAWNQGCQSNESAENEAYTIGNLIQQKIDALKEER